MCEKAHKLQNKNLTLAYRIQFRYPFDYSPDRMHFYKTNVILYIYITNNNILIFREESIQVDAIFPSENGHEIALPVNTSSKDWTNVGSAQKLLHPCKATFRINVMFLFNYQMEPNALWSFKIVEEYHWNHFCQLACG